MPDEARGIFIPRSPNAAASLQKKPLPGSGREQEQTLYILRPVERQGNKSFKQNTSKIVFFSARFLLNCAGIFFLFYFSIRRHPENPTRRFFALPPDFSPSAAIEGRSDSRSSPLFLARNSPSHSGIASILSLQQILQHYIIQFLPIGPPDPISPCVVKSRTYSTCRRKHFFSCQDREGGRGRRRGRRRRETSVVVRSLLLLVAS